jgi:signal transduction histidine kinase
LIQRQINQYLYRIIWSFYYIRVNVPQLMKKISFEYKITLIYILIGALWILFSDQIVISLFSEKETIHLLSTVKGWLYVAVTGILLFYFIKKEIKRRNLLYNELLVAKKKSEEADNLKSAFLANLSHYIRTPMNSILGFIDLLKNRNLSEEKYLQFIQIIDKRSNHLLQTLESIVEISKIQQGQYLINKTKLNLKKLVRDVIIPAETEINQSNKLLIFKMSFDVSTENTEIESDRIIISQILSNLISNAVNFTEQGVIEIKCKSDKNNFIIEVIDSGKGVSPEKQDIIFDEFMYHSSDTLNKGEGAGLGLHLSAKLASLINGKLWLEETGKSGSIFCLSLPRSF